MILHQISYFFRDSISPLILKFLIFQELTSNFLYFYKSRYTKWHKISYISTTAPNFLCFHNPVHKIVTVSTPTLHQLSYKFPDSTPNFTTTIHCSLQYKWMKCIGTGGGGQYHSPTNFSGKQCSRNSTGNTCRKRNREQYNFAFEKFACIRLYCEDEMLRGEPRLRMLDNKTRARRWERGKKSQNSDTNVEICTPVYLLSRYTRDIRIKIESSKADR